MDATIITPFLGSARHVFGTMLRMRLREGSARVKRKREFEHEVNAVIPFSGALRGVAALSMPRDVGERLVEALAGVRMEAGSEDFRDAVGELANLVFGGGKALLPRAGEVTIGCPRVTEGVCKAPGAKESGALVVVDCEAECGGFTMEMALGWEEKVKSGK